MTAPAIKAEGLWKEYTVGAVLQQRATIYDLVARAIKAPFDRMHRLGGYADDASRFWALRDIAFDIQAGDTVGIIGRNGAGKSTLLKILSRITDPTRGKATIRGRVASLLEVGTGFHPELTGRENIFLNGAVLGMSRLEIKKKLDEIVAFAEVERFLETPVKRYSSGMYVRLAFSVAAHLDPEILIVDEVLAVGDFEFQKKCLGKMEAAGSKGRTVVLVSHNMNAISSLCTRVLWLDQGKLVRSGSAREVIREYMSQHVADSLLWVPPTPGNSPFRYHRVEVLSGSSVHCGDGFRPDAPLVFEFDYTVSGTIASGRIGLVLTDQEGVVVLGSANSDGTPTLDMTWTAGRSISRCNIPAHFLAPGRYHVSISEPADAGSIVHEAILSFRISELGSLKSRDGRRGIVAPLLSWQSEQIESGSVT